MTTDERLKIYVKYQYLIDNVVQKYSPDKYNIDDLYYAGIGGLFLAIDEYKNNIIHMEDRDFIVFVIFHIKNAINKILNNKD